MTFLLIRIAAAIAAVLFVAWIVRCATTQGPGDYPHETSISHWD